MIRLGGRCGTVSQGAAAPDLSGAATVSLEVVQKLQSCQLMDSQKPLGFYDNPRVNVSQNWTWTP